MKQSIIGKSDVAKGLSGVNEEPSICFVPTLRIKIKVVM